MTRTQVLSIFMAFVALVTAPAIESAQRSPDSSIAERLWLLPPGGTRAVLDGSSTLSDVTRRFGRENVQESQIYLGGGSPEVAGTVVFAPDPKRRIEIVWKEGTRRTPEVIRVYGGASQWVIGPGITLGTSLTDIERFNGGPFTLLGFDWDYSGTIVDWQRGRLGSWGTGCPHVYVRLNPDDNVIVRNGLAADIEQVEGSRDFSSSTGPMQRLNPRVWGFEVDYGTHWCAAGPR